MRRNVNGGGGGSQSPRRPRRFRNIHRKQKSRQQPQQHCLQNVVLVLLLIGCGCCAVWFFYLSHAMPTTTPTTTMGRHFPLQPANNNKIEGKRHKDPVTMTTTKRTTSCLCVDCTTDPVCGGLWRGSAVGGDPFRYKRIQLVVSHCTSSLDWMVDFVASHHQSQTTSLLYHIAVFSKCATPARIPTALQNLSTVWHLPNLGGNDHSYLYWIYYYHYGNRTKTKTTQQQEEPDVVVFIKDTFRTNERIAQPGVPRDLSEMLRIASVRRFACAVELRTAQWDNQPPVQLSAYHHTEQLRNFVLNNYQRQKTSNQHVTNNNTNNSTEPRFNRPFFRRLARFAKHFQYPFPVNVTEVCYGGSFAVEPGRFQTVNVSTWKKMEFTLRRGDNIEESHHMERTWAAVLSPPLTNPDHMEALWQHSSGIALRRGAIMGALKREIQTS